MINKREAFKQQDESMCEKRRDFRMRWAKFIIDLAEWALLQRERPDKALCKDECKALK